MPDPNDPAGDAAPGTPDLRSEAFTWDAPDRSLLSSDFGDAPRFPVDMLGPFWSQWVTLSSRSANAPVDYTAGTLLATVGAMLGNVRWPNVEGVWEHERARRRRGRPRRPHAHRAPAAGSEGRPGPAGA